MKVILNKVRIAFPDIFEATQYQGKGAFRYNATYLIEPGSQNDINIRAAIKAEAQGTYGKKADALLASMQNNTNKYCYISGDTKPDYDGYPGKMYLAGHRKQADGPPLVIDSNRSPLTANSGKPYAGCYVNATVDIYAQDGENAGIRCGLIGIQFAGDGEAFGGASRPNVDDFEDCGTEESLV
jgi:hypothetical protein